MEQTPNKVRNWPRLLIDTVCKSHKITISIQGVVWNPKNSFAFDERVKEWQTRLDSLDNVTVKTVSGDHHFIIDNYEITSKLIHDFIDSNK